VGSDERSPTSQELGVGTRQVEGKIVSRLCTRRYLYRWAEADRDSDGEFVTREELDRLDVAAQSGQMVSV